MKIALVGAGKIVLSCLDALKDIAGIDIAALCVRQSSLQKGEALKSHYHIHAIYTDYDAMLQDSNIDVVYLGIPNHLHFSYSHKALSAGKHVICEKPFTSNYAQLLELVTLAKSTERYLFEAITSIHTPGFDYLQTHVAEVGEIKLVQANYSQYSSRYNDYVNGIVHPAFDPAASGGALYDINLYNIYNVCALFGAPESVSYTCNKGHNGIDTSGILVMNYGKFIAVCTGAKDSASPGYLTIQGTAGYVKITDIPSVCKHVEFSKAGTLIKHDAATDKNHMIYEFEAFRDIVNAQDMSRCYELLDIALIVSKVLEQARECCGIDFPLTQE
ncbi:Gfo/Idh/MocA family protein [Dickeya dianthicola]|uniref:Gfo/Idh/MocA family protein n=1 Tax=Dickeya dianthicola TaxID=204039 RepID=UPI001866A516|nr:Gfo/Idh/MocA family oxidoreductase [Dickeya dianthicola]QOL14059.1 Gfo/Idh/MocA family oxidoreductase [Dickeya dianthicola]